MSTDAYHYEAWKKSADREGIYFDRIIDDWLRGVSRLESLEIMLESAPRIYTTEEKCVWRSRRMISTARP